MQLGKIRVTCPLCKRQWERDGKIDFPRYDNLTKRVIQKDALLMCPHCHELFNVTNEMFHLGQIELTDISWIPGRFQELADRTRFTIADGKRFTILEDNLCHLRSLFPQSSEIDRCAEILRKAEDEEELRKLEETKKRQKMPGLTYTIEEIYNEVKLDCELPNFGTLKGELGDIQFSRCEDGISIHNSPLLASGFASPCSNAVNVPAIIGEVDVVEVHQDVYLRRTEENTISIEGRNLKRVYLTIHRESVPDNVKNPQTRLDISHAILRDLEEKRTKGMPLEFHIVQHTRRLDTLKISCNEKCKTSGKYINQGVKLLKLDAPEVILDGNMKTMETVEFSGPVYPHVYYDRYGEVSETDCFAGNGDLKAIIGTLKGKYPWNFRDCVSLKQVRLGNGCEKMADFGFANCGELEDLYVPDTVITVGRYLFCNCTLLKSVHLPQDIKIIEEGMFKGCASLKKCFLSDNLEEIQDNAFEGCSSLSDPWIPKNLRKIGTRAFYGCVSFRKITIPGSITEIQPKAFGGCPNLLLRCYPNTEAHKYALREGVQFQLLE